MIDQLAITILDDEQRVISFLIFSSETQHDAMLKECKQKGIKTKLMTETQAHEYLKSKKPVQ